MLFVPAVYFFVNLQPSQKHGVVKLMIKTVVLALPAFVVVGIIRYINIDRPHLGGAWHLYENMRHIGSPLLIFNVFWVLAFLKFKEKPLFLQRALWTIPLFVIPHMITGRIAETRQMIPLSFIIIPSSIFFLIEWRKGMLHGRLAKSGG
jgi:hypothetical protein